MTALVEIRDFRLSFDTFDGTAQVLDGINLTLNAGDTLGIVGETGCGKSVLARSLLALNPSPPARIVSGEIRFRGDDILRLPERGMRKLRGRAISMVFQDPASYLNPLLSVGTQMEDAIRGQDAAAGARARPRHAARALAAVLLAAVGLPEPARLLDSHPHQLSGGMRQRVLIAMALAGEPALLVADEPTTALDVTVQAQVLALIARLVADRGLALMLISHDLGVVAASCARVAVMYAGTVVEEAPTTELLARPLHPYARGLIAAVPDLDRPDHRPQGIPGSIPGLIAPPTGCRFHPRCPAATHRCRTEKPLPRALLPGRAVACHHAVP
ncbi:ABC transporter ATP-binding protein [Roseomonas sp. CECT 9278]|uniref:ABC transporter ATP-binding protein n=1 Tax=Roseomonas sp. CECT 9278 TaxID=2845823 RepID=UPI001E555CF4|nr:ABC transporter ATP-binding protein [Roseomonas sp. CECT 9278]CAH0264773.1 Oligopeptide transport ATP-binding protein OppD [Roseomonas sp. CECT 9278]